jgi:uncharacterized membrane protein YkvA (DUF1232 family)
MNELTTRCLDTFPEWLRSLGTDAGELSALLDGDALTTDAKRHVAAALNYLFKSLDLIPDGIEDLGFLDDAFVVRVAAKHALASNGDKAKPEALVRLAEGAALVEELLGVDYKRLVKYVEGLINGAARGRTTEEIVSDETIRETFRTEVGGWSASYEPPSFSRDEKNIVKLASFLTAKLPA